MPADADLAAAFSIPVSAKPAAGVRRAIRDGPHKNMQAGKKRDFIRRGLTLINADFYGGQGGLGIVDCGLKERRYPGDAPYV